VLLIEFQHRAGFQNGGKLALLHGGEDRRLTIGRAVRRCDHAVKLVILAQRIEGLHVGGGDAHKADALLVKLGVEFLAVARCGLGGVKNGLLDAGEGAGFLPFDLLPFNPRRAVRFAHNLFRGRHAQKLIAVDTAEALLNFFPKIAGHALIDTGDVAALIDGCETFFQQAILTARRFGERMRALAGLGFVGGDIDQDQAALFDFLCQLVRAAMPGDIPCQPNFARRSAKLALRVIFFGR
jgi:hypothetical protein